MHNSSYSTHVPRVHKSTQGQTNSLSNKLLLHSVTHIYSPELKGDRCHRSTTKAVENPAFLNEYTFTDALRNKQEINTVSAGCVYVVSTHPCGSLHLTPLIVTTQSSSINRRVNLVFWFISFYHSLSPSTLFTLCRLYFHPRASTLLAFG